ncbi:MAG: M48 family metallopeptidase [Myxococcota bacterium]
MRGLMVLLVGTLVLSACQRVPVTNRRQFNLIPDGIMRGVGKSSYTSMLSETKVKRKGTETAILNRVGRRISKVADQPKYDWTFSLINEDVVNAWALPGGYIAFYQGILPVLQNEAGMAFVMGHEVAHATARHGSERLSQQAAMVGGLAGLEIYMANATKIKPQQRVVILGALGVASQVGVILPFSRKHESEADIIGMMYMAEAGYPPQESPKVWDRMAAGGGGSDVPVFLSTHPSHNQRKKTLTKWMPMAKKKYARHKAAPGDTLATIFTK